uniref:Putative ovule protein n=1 Tax=Solanum chacoense TaxID=4108 RepID=A0A0V0HNK9_SOLCH
MLGPWCAVPIDTSSTLQSHYRCTNCYPISTHSSCFNLTNRKCGVWSQWVHCLLPNNCIAIDLKVQSWRMK